VSRNQESRLVTRTQAMQRILLLHPVTLRLLFTFHCVKADVNVKLQV